MPKWLLVFKLLLYWEDFWSCRDPSNSFFCYAQDYSVHFFSVASFLWTTTIAFTLHRTVVKHQTDVEDYGSIFHLYVWGMTMYLFLKYFLIETIWYWFSLLKWSCIFLRHHILIYHCFACFLCHGSCHPTDGLNSLNDSTIMYIHYWCPRETLKITWNIQFHILLRGKW